MECAPVVVLTVCNSADYLVWSAVYLIKQYPPVHAFTTNFEIIKRIWTNKNVFLGAFDFISWILSVTNILSVKHPHIMSVQNSMVTSKTFNALLFIIGKMFGANLFVRTEAFVTKSSSLPGSKLDSVFLHPRTEKSQYFQSEFDFFFCLTFHELCAHIYLDN